MRALVMMEPSPSASATKVADRPEPEPGPHEVSVDVAYAGVNFIDVMARRGDPGYASAWPYVPGLEIAGTVRRVGSEVVALHRGSAWRPSRPAAAWPRSRWPGPNSSCRFPRRWRFRWQPLPR